MNTRQLIYEKPEGSGSNPNVQFLTEEEQNQLKYQALLEGQMLGISNLASSSQSNSLMVEEVSTPNKSSVLKDCSNKILQYKTPTKGDSSSKLKAPISSLLFNWAEFGEENASNFRKITTKPCRVLDAPQLEDDYYLNLLDWSSSDVLAVALQGSIHLWSGDTGMVNQLCQLPDEQEIYTSVAWSAKADRLATGISNGKLEIWDFHKMKVIRSDLEAHKGRVSCLSWNNNNILATGSKDRSIILRDMRIQGNESSIGRFRGHKQEICGLKWSYNDFQIASGGNDNKLYVWNARMGEPEACFTDHKAAVKALTWSPHQSGLLLSGGGNSDKTIKVWNTHTMKNIKSINTGSQVCNMVFSKNSNELVTTHGFSNNQITVWNYPDFQKVGVMEGHSSRVLYLALSPDGETIVTGAGDSDETLRFWNVFPQLVRGDKSLLVPSLVDLR